MSSDENRAGRRRPRLIPRPRLDPGPVKDLNDVLYELYLHAGAPTLDEIACEVDNLADELADELHCDAAEVDRLIGAAPKRDTIGRVIGGAEAPTSQQDVVAVAVALARTAGHLPHQVTLRNLAALVEQVRNLWVRAHMTPPPPPTRRLGKPISDYTPFELEVHRAIDMDDQRGELPPLPPYVPRAHDALLRQVVKEATDGAPRVVMLVGGSSTGKTRLQVAGRILCPRRDWDPVRGW